MLNEPATTPKNPKAKVAFGILVGLLSMLFRYFGSYEIGVCFAILLVNATEGYVDRFFEKGGFQMVKSEIGEIQENLQHGIEAVQKDVADKKAEKVIEKTVEKVQEHKADPSSKNRKKGKNKSKQTQGSLENLDNTSTFDIISRAEDKIDQVSFSTQTVDMEEALRSFDEKYNKGR